MKTILNLLFGLLTLIFQSCSTGYRHDAEAVYYEHWNEGSGQHRSKIDADPKTFQVLEFDTYAKDKKSVFYKGEKIIGADEGFPKNSYAI